MQHPLLDVFQTYLGEGVSQLQDINEVQGRRAQGAWLPSTAGGCQEGCGHRANLWRQANSVDG